MLLAWSLQLLARVALAGGATCGAKKERTSNGASRFCQAWSASSITQAALRHSQRLSDTRALDALKTPCTPPRGHSKVMAGLRTALRLAPRAQFLRPSTIPSNLAKRTYASAPAIRRPATDDKIASEAEQASEDVGDPNMVCRFQQHNGWTRVDIQDMGRPLGMQER